MSVGGMFDPCADFPNGIIDVGTCRAEEFRRSLEVGDARSRATHPACRFRDLVENVESRFQI